MTLMDRLTERQGILARVQQAIVEAAFLEVEADDLDPDAPLFGTGIGLDSIDAVELLVALESHFGMRLQEDRVLAVPHLRTINTIVDRILADAAAEEGA
ncbi:MAG: acyl carrier protein [Deltaproteobacteria bacterium]|nr:MAG: acyl carrier protein [Deltaproteobacteria bacterium]